jgi:hypothetical protein
MAKVVITNSKAYTSGILEHGIGMVLNYIFIILSPWN